MKNYGFNPYIPMGNWGTYHKKACKGGNPPETGGGTTEKCECKDSGGSNLSTLNLRVHNTTITNKDGLKAIATITVTKNNGDPHIGLINTITKTTLTKAGSSELKITASLKVGEILTLSGAPATDGTEVQIEGTIIVTKAGTLGDRITLDGRLDGTLSLTNDTSDITVKKGVGSLNAKDPANNLALHGINVNIGSLAGTATMEITTTNSGDDLTKLDKVVNIRIIKLTKDKVASLANSGGQLKRETALKSGDTLKLVGTANAGSTITGLKVSGTITIGGTDGKLEGGLSFSGDIAGSLTLQDAPDGVTVQSGGNTLTLPQDKLNVLKNTNFSLTTDDKRALTYESELVTKSKITIGTIATTNNVKLSGLSLIPVCITGTGASTGFKATANLSLTHTQSIADNSLKEPGGQTIDLTSSLSNANVTITKGEDDKVQSLSTGDLLNTNTTLNPGDTLSLKITGTDTTLEGTISVTSSGNLTGEVTLKGGIEASSVTLQGSGELTSTGPVTISNLKYDPDEFHVNHQSDSCVLVPLNYI